MICLIPNGAVLPVHLIQVQILLRKRVDIGFAHPGALTTVPGLSSTAPDRPPSSDARTARPSAHQVAREEMQEVAQARALLKDIAELLRTSDEPEKIFGIALTEDAWAAVVGTVMSLAVALVLPVP